MLFALIQAVFANAGTPLMWGAALHLLAGNAIIGTFEGLLLITLFKARTKTTLLVMIAANYLSAWLGLLLIPAVANFADMDINTIRPWFWIMTGVTYGATVLIEWPFVIACVGTFRRSVLASFTVQAISYTLLFGFYWMLSTTSLFREVEIVPAREIPLPESVEFYYIGAGDGNVYHLGSTTGQPEMIHELKSKNPWDRLYWRASKAEPRQGDLVARLDDESRTGRTLEIRKGLSGESKLETRLENTWFNFGQVESVSESVTGRWDFNTQFWAGGGLTGRPKKGSAGAAGGIAEIHIALETPFASWIARNAILLPEDKVLFQLGSNQICLLDAATRRLALVCYGRGPVAVLNPAR